MSDVDQEFAELRGLLARPYQGDDWEERLCSLLKTTHLRHPVLYAEVFVPYCEQHKALFTKPIDVLHSVEALEEWSSVAPFALYELNLFGSGLDMQELLALFESPLLARVQDFFCGRNQIEYYLFGMLAQSPYLGNLRMLELAENSIDSYTLQAHLVHTEAFARVEELDLSLNAIDDEGAAAIAKAEHLKCLKVLDLSGTYVSEEGLWQIEGSPLLPSLRELIS